MNYPNDPYRPQPGQPGQHGPHGQYVQPGYGPGPYAPPPRKSSAALIVGLCGGFALILLITLWATGALDRMFGRGQATASVNVTQPAPAPAPAAKAPDLVPAAPAPALVATPAPAPVQQASNDWIAGRWCAGNGDSAVFDAATGQMIVTDANGTETLGYQLSGTRLVLQGPGGEVRATAIETGPSEMTLTTPGEPRETMTRC